MSALWLPASRITFGAATSAPAGSLIIETAQFRQASTSVAIRVDHMLDSSPVRQLAYAITPWFQGHFRPGDIFALTADQRCAFFTLQDDDSLTVEFDPLTDSVDGEGDNLLALTGHGTRLVGLWGRHDVINRGPILVDHESWSTWRPQTNGQGAFSYFKSWRFALRIGDDDPIHFGGNPTKTADDA